MWALGSSNWRGFESPGQRMRLSSVFHCLWEWDLRVEAKCWDDSMSVMDVCQRPDGSFWSLNMRTAQVNFIFCHLILISSHFTRLKQLLFHPFTSVSKVANYWNLTNDVYFRKLLQSAQVPSAPRALESGNKVVVFFLWFMLGSFIKVHDLTD